MSGGYFDYIQYRIEDVQHTIEDIVDRSGKPLTDKEIKESLYWGSEQTHHEEYPEDIILEFKKAVHLLKTAKVYVQRIDWLLSGDDGEESFRIRLQKDLAQIKQQDNGHN
jgi:hypothetical protein